MPFVVNLNAMRDSTTQRMRAIFAKRARQKEERDFAFRVCDETIAALNVVVQTRAELQGDALYAAVVARRGNLDAGQAAAIVEGANEALEDWGNDRKATLIDVIRYMIVKEYMAQHANDDGMIIDLGALLAPLVDPKL